MNVKDLEKLLENTEDKLSAFSSENFLSEYNLSANLFIKVLKEYLNDEEKAKLFEYTHFSELDFWIKKDIFSTIFDGDIKFKLLTNEKFSGTLKSYNIVELVKKSEDSVKKRFLYCKEFIERHEIRDHELKSIISEMEKQAKFDVLSDKDFVKKGLELKNWQIADLILELSNNDEKKKLLNDYDLENHLKFKVISSLSNEDKIEFVLKEKDFRKLDCIDVLKTLDNEALGAFLKTQKEFLNENNISPFEIIRGLDAESQKEFMIKFEELDLTINEKREILVILKDAVKKGIDISSWPQEYKTAISLQTDEYNRKIIIDLDRNLEDYRGLDNLLRVNPENFTEEQKRVFSKLCDICPNMKVISVMNAVVEHASSVKEYLEAEEWINTVISELKPEYTVAQKVAVIDNAIGKKISYSPDYETEVFNHEESRALWKIISTGYGVCNGIAKVEKYIFDRVGIESEIISSDNHSFLKLIDIELPLASGETIKGNTILDPTWNLASHRFSGRPDNFCINYEKARQNDIDANGKDHNCHNNDEKLQDATLMLDDESLRALFTSVGLARDDGKFPIVDLATKSQKVHEECADKPYENIAKQLLLLSMTCPEFATCQNSSMKIMKDILLNNENMRFNKCVVNRVFDKEDETKKPVLYVYIDSKELGQKFFVANKENGYFEDKNPEDFEKRFECYEADIIKNKGLRPWQVKENEKEIINLANSSGSKRIDRGEER